MKVYRCDEMMCDGCVSRIDKALDGAGIRHTVSLDEKKVTVEDDGKAGEAVELLDDLGFTAVEQ